MILILDNSWSIQERIFCVEQNFLNFLLKRHKLQLIHFHIHNFLIVAHVIEHMIFLAVMEFTFLKEVRYRLLGEIDLLLFRVVMLMLLGVLDSCEELVSSFGLEELQLYNAFGHVEPIFTHLKLLVLFLSQH